MAQPLPPLKPFVPAVYDSFADAIGNTPVILLKGASKRTGCKYVLLCRKRSLMCEVVSWIDDDAHTIMCLLCCFTLQNLRKVRILESW